MSTNDSASLESTGTTIVASPTDSTPEIDWHGPFAEWNDYGRRNSSTYVQYPDCGIEVLTGRRTHAIHREGCRHR